ncbi:Non-specific DNA-binding protein Dps / Iron-binding ferritin-like antioxidant protein / Ferroxidase [Acidisarcina polymorpha]|uniref:Non-specific DNA-binding protein Dps / Iron-binding ferritin-like antioxidant protein / Ferroxidase n=1 Tax=Acidisarcina polymorpha TaxID=2211140 RepID=A0A2Z5FZV1_9BACT|nr:DNA starvation/stationary phase protection protein [Acidisarcina polymorpha]AXC12398.1 Non-specific DNA-binding protein Dps / Iron-binding ferritin-like antioxidant protein / Ferroxidase [Acidisarcina polymorpha]
MPTLTSKEQRLNTNGAKKTVVPTSFPAPANLATPTDLTPDDVSAVTAAVNPLIADSFALYTKTKNFHWHLSGVHFRDFHLLFDTQADEILESIDILAERVRRIGGTTIRSITHVSQLQTIQDDNDDFVEPLTMIQRLRDDNRHIAQMQRAAIKVCNDHNDSATSNQLESILDETEKRTWFLYEISLGAVGGV